MRASIGTRHRRKAAQPAASVRSVRHHSRARSPMSSLTVDLRWFRNAESGAERLAGLAVTFQPDGQPVPSLDDLPEPAGVIRIERQRAIEDRERRFPDCKEPVDADAERRVVRVIASDAPSGSHRRPERRFGHDPKSTAARRGATVLQCRSEHLNGLPRPRHEGSGRSVEHISRITVSGPQRGYALRPSLVFGFRKHRPAGDYASVTERIAMGANVGDRERRAPGLVGRDETQPVAVADAFFWAQYR